MFLSVLHCGFVFLLTASVVARRASEVMIPKLQLRCNGYLAQIRVELERI